MSDVSDLKGINGVLLFLKGAAMGAADVVPGVSGGTIAFITGIYERLLNAVKTLHPMSLAIWLKEGFAAFWKAIDGYFLLLLFSGILVSILSLAKVIHYALDHHPIAIWSFFFGLVLASIAYLVRQIPRWHWYEVIALAMGAIIAITISMLRPAELPAQWWMMFFAGFVAICAMILPGISGSFILLLMGMYRVVIEALNNLDLLLLVSFAVGCVVGLLSFSHLLSYFLKRYFSVMLALLTGFLLGSLNVLWPWKEVIESTVNRHGELIPLVQANVLPADYTQIYNEPAYLVTAIMTASVGFLIVFLLERLGKQ